MRLLRWKRPFRSGDGDTDRRNRAFVDCLNKLIKAADEREHCREMEDFIGRFGADAEKTLREHPADRDLSAEFGRRLLASLPLDPYGGNACRSCGLCDLAQEKIAAHLAEPADCLFKDS